MSPRRTDGMPSAWRYGTRRIGNVLVVRDRWQGLFGPNGLLIGLLVAAGFLLPIGWNLVCWVAAPIVAWCLHPVVYFGPTTVRWRNRIGFGEVPTSAIVGLEITDFNPGRGWVPVVTGVLDPDRSSRLLDPKFVSTFSYRVGRARVLSTAISTWAHDLGIECHLPPDRMTWRMVPPLEDSNGPTSGMRPRRVRGHVIALAIGLVITVVIVLTAAI